MGITWKQQMGVVPAPQNGDEETGMVDVRAMAASITRALVEKKQRRQTLNFGGEAALQFQNAARMGLLLPPRRVGFFQKTWVLATLAFFGSLMATGVLLLILLLPDSSSDAAAALPPLLVAERPAPLQEEAALVQVAPAEEEVPAVTSAPEEAALEKAAPAKKSRAKRARAKKTKPVRAKAARTKKKNSREADELLRLLN